MGRLARADPVRHSMDYAPADGAAGRMIAANVYISIGTACLHRRNDPVSGQMGSAGSEQVHGLILRSSGAARPATSGRPRLRLSGPCSRSGADRC